MGDGISGDVDLFGDPVIYRDPKVGRPEHVRTQENANKVSLLFACGHSVKDVAKALGISQPTLRLHYFHEVAQRGVTALKMKAKQLARLNAQAEAGNVAAEKALLGMIEREQVRQLADRVADRGKTKQPKARPLGKKEEQRLAASEVAGRFATREPPKLLMN